MAKTPGEKVNCAEISQTNSDLILMLTAETQHKAMFVDEQCSGKYCSDAVRVFYNHSMKDKPTNI